MRKDRKSQVTIFIVLGIVLMIIFGFLFFIVNYISNFKMQQEANMVMEELVSTTAINAYVTSCLDAASKEAFKLAASQGGVIYATQFPLEPEESLYAGHLVFEFIEDQPDPLDISYYYAKHAVPYITDDPETEDQIVNNVTFGLSPRTILEGDDASEHPLYDDSPLYPYSGLEQPATYIPLNPEIAESQEYLSPLAAPHTYSGVYDKDAFSNNRNKLLPLCTSTGANRRFPGWNIDEAENTCIGSYGGTHFSVQGIIQKYIGKKVKQCVEFESFGDILGHNVEEGDVESLLTFGNDDVRIDVNYPIIIDVQDGQPITRMLEFSTNLDIRFKDLYFSAVRIAREDVNNAFFDIQRDTYFDDQIIPGKCHSDVGTVYDAENPLGDATTCLLDGMSLEKIPEVCLNPLLCDQAYSDSTFYNDPHDDYVDIIKITDDESRIDGVPLVFQFAVENRKPALDHIYVLEGNLYPEEFDIVVVEGDTITLDPKGYDPDEDNHNLFDDFGRSFMGSSYSYSLWKETTNEWCDITLCQEISGDSADPLCGEYPYDACIRPIGEFPGWPDSPTEEAIADYFVFNRWTSSDLFLNNGERMASYSTVDPTEIDPDSGYPQHPDMGPHTVRAIVCDPEEAASPGSGYCDHQDIEILVIDLPAAIITWNSIYDDILPEFVVSKEDPTILDASDTVIVFGELTNFLWEDIIDDSTLVLEDGEEYIVPIPYYYDDTLRNIESIEDVVGIDDYFQTEEAVEDHTVRLIASADDPPRETETEETYEIFQCLPHHEDELVAMYPYNQFEGNSEYNTYSSSVESRSFEIEDTQVILPGEYFTSHICCLGDPATYVEQDLESVPVGWGVYADQDVSCFDFTSYAPAWNFDFTRFIGEDVYGSFNPGDYEIYWEWAVGEATQSDTKLLSDGIPFDITSDAGNDIYIRGFERFCSGDRGNVCSGMAGESITMFDACDDLDPDFQDERCSGPPDDFALGGWPELADPGDAQCIDYSETTFEYLFGQGTGHCDNDYRCANTARTQFETPGHTPYKCFSFCDDGSCSMPDSDSCVCDDDNCDAEELCDEKLPGDELGTPLDPICSEAGEVWFEDVCSISCVYEDRSGQICELTGSDCNPDPDPIAGTVPNDNAVACDGRVTGYSWDEDGNSGLKEQGCENDCTHVDCGFYTFNSAAKQCRTEATANYGHCNDDYGRDSTFNKCISCQDDVETGGDNPNRRCESTGEDCDAAAQCDELVPFSFTANGWCGGNGCDQHCVGWIDDDGDNTPDDGDICAAAEADCADNQGQRCEFVPGTPEYGTCYPNGLCVE